LSSFLHGSQFYREVSLQYDMEEGVGGPEMPNTSVDFIEVDSMGRLHLWEAKLLHSYELTSGRVMGQMMFYDWLFRTYKRDLLRPRLKAAGIDTSVIHGFDNSHERLRFCSWNILVCGGEGFEIAAGVNPVMWNHHVIPTDYFHDDAPKVATYHLYHDQSEEHNGLVVQDLWHLSVFNPARMERNALLAYLNSDENWIYSWKIEAGEIVLALRDGIPSEMIGLACQVPESTFWRLNGRKHLLDEE
jgi:hypothetical protein